MKRVICVLCMILLFAMLPVPVYAETHGEAYEQLSSDALREAYCLLEEGIAGMAPVIHFPKELNIWYNDLLEIIRAVCLDHPEYFWFLETGFYEYGTKDSKFLVETITPTYYLDHEQVSAGSQALADAMVSFQSKVSEIIAGIPVNCTDDYEIALYLHDYLAEHVRYTLEGDHDSAYAALIHGEAACYGYSKAYHYLLTRAGVRSRIIVGDSLDKDGSAYGHAWNQVWIDGKCYYTDVTWDDLEIGTTHRYFMVSLEDISADHVAEGALPECGHSLDFYQRCAGRGVATISDRMNGYAAAEHFQLESLAECEAVFTCDAHFEGDAESWLDRSAIGIVKALGLSTNAELFYYCFDDVYFLILTDSAYVPSYREANRICLNLTEVTLRGTGAQVKLEAEVTPFSAGILMPVFTSDNEAVVTVDSDGMVKAVGPGTATVTVSSADGSVTAQCVITVEEGDIHLHSMRLIGASDPTCTLDGNDPYYLCTGCYHRFADEDGTQELVDVSDYARLATGHIDLIWYPKDKTNSHYQLCSCGLFMPGTTAPHKDLDEDGLCDQCGAEMRSPTQEAPVEDDAGPNYSGMALIGGGVLAAGIAVFLFIKRRW